MEVIGVGFGRTGTLSLKAALEQLGFGPCYHMANVLLDHPEHARSWDAAARGERIDWDQLLGGYRATVDSSGCYFWRDLLATYPHAKVILTVT